MKEITIFIYLLLTLSWLYILFFSVNEILKGRSSSKSLFGVLFAILIIDSVRTLIESVYFGTRLASQYGILPEELFKILSNPSYLFIPKLINAIAAITIIVLIFRKWYPEKVKEEDKLRQKYEEEKADKLRLAQLNKNLDELVYQKTKELEELNLDLEKRVKEEVEKNKKTQQTLLEQSKMAAMGEMLRNIAHQWRQPLSIMTTSASGIRIEKDFGTLNDEILEKNLNQIIDTGQHLSHTIDDFQNFFKPNKKISEFYCKELIDRSLNIVGPAFKSSGIDIELEVECSCNIKGYYNEYVQVLMNLLNNARDVLKDKEIDEKVVKIFLKQKDGNCIVEVLDNGGGIGEDIIDRIFEPYFTTKHQSQGTGIGLYMSKEMIEKHMNGKIEAKNVEFEHNGKNYKGAKFSTIVKSISCECGENR